MRRFPLWLSGLALLFAVGACGGDDDDHDHQHPDGSNVVDCSMETRAETYTANMEKTGAMQNLKVTLISSTPAPPEKGDNTWMLKIADLADQPVAGATVAVTPFMPDHGHGTQIQTVVTETSTAGEYEADPVNLWMPGLWEVTIEVDTGTVQDEVVFAFCIEG